MADDRLLSGFMNHDYVVTFAMTDEARRARLLELCAGPWQGDEVVSGTWEISNDLSPDGMEKALLEIMGEGDRVAFYYLTTPMRSGFPGGAETKRIYRVIL
jgi:hypothetical protein